MMRTTQKEIKGLVKEGIATDITNANNATYKEFMANEGYYDIIACSVGMYGRNGLVIKGHNTGNLYAITSRASALFIFG